MLKVRKPLLVFAGVTICVVTLVVPVLGQERPIASPTGTSPAEWQRFTVEEEEFSADFPVTPALTTRTVRLFKANKDRLERVIGAYAGGVVYTIHTFENSKRKQSLEELIAEFNRGSIPDISRDLLLGSFRGKEYSYESDGRKGVIQFYITQKHIYRFHAVGSTLVNPDAALARFISSIRLEKHPVGIEIENGPGAQAAADPSDRIFTGKEVDQKATVFTKPEPRYTADARKNQVTGTVVLRAVFTSSGSVTNIRALSGLPDGLTERAIAAAQQLRFLPAIKDGNFVSMHIHLEYNFNLY